MPVAELLVAVIQDPDILEEVLTGFLEIGIPGATIIESAGMGKLLGNEVPEFAGLQSLISRARPENRTLFSVIRDPRKIEAALELLARVCGRLDEPSTGIAFTVPVSRVHGLATALPAEGN